MKKNWRGEKIVVMLIQFTWVLHKVVPLPPVYRQCPLARLRTQSRQMWICEWWSECRDPEPEDECLLQPCLAASSHTPVLLIVLELQTNMKTIAFSPWLRKAMNCFVCSSSLAASSYTPVLAIVRMQQLQHGAVHSAAHTCSKPDCHNLPDISWLYSCKHQQSNIPF